MDSCGPGEPVKQSKASKQATAGDETKSCGAAGAPFGCGGGGGGKGKAIQPSSRSPELQLWLAVWQGGRERCGAHAHCQRVSTSLKSEWVICLVAHPPRPEDKLLRTHDAVRDGVRRHVCLVCMWVCGLLGDEGGVDLRSKATPPAEQQRGWLNIGLSQCTRERKRPLDPDASIHA